MTTLLTLSAKFQPFALLALFVFLFILLSFQMKKVFFQSVFLLLILTVGLYLTEKVLYFCFAAVPFLFFLWKNEVFHRWDRRDNPKKNK